MSGTIHNKNDSARLCRACGNSGFGSDCFCRRCGAQQTEQIVGRFTRLNDTASLAITNGLGSQPSYATAPLAPEDGYHTFSGPLVKLITASLTSVKTARLKSCWSKRLTLAVISIPIWLLIVLLSPLDAYVAAKTTVAGS